MSKPNDCGGCTACCRIMEIEMLNKPGDVRCPHQGAKGCLIYATKPEECITYTCAWLESQSQSSLDERWPDEWRPDRSGIVADSGGLDPSLRMIVLRVSRGMDRLFDAGSGADIVHVAKSANLTVIGKVGTLPPKKL